MAFARFTPFGIGASRPPSSSGLSSQAHAPTSAPRTTSRLTSRSTEYNVESAIQAFSSNPECDKVVVAGKESLKILAVGYNYVHELHSLRITGVQKRNYNQSEVKWGTSPVRDIIASASSYGIICIYKDWKQERMYQDHQRQVNRLSFNPHNGNFLLSASQDGYIKLWDLRSRDKRSQATFHGKADAVRDVQFHPRDGVIFAAAYEDGSIQRWDFRKDSMSERKISHCHAGPVFTIDWHPDGKHIASGGRDRTIKVWDFSDEPRKNAKHTVYTQNSIGRVVWRPQGFKTTQLASCYNTASDYQIYVWDLKRRYIAERVMSDHFNSITGLQWKDEDILWSSGRDALFIQHDVKFTHQPITTLSHEAFAWNVDDEFTFALQKRKRLRAFGSSNIPPEEEYASGGNLKSQIGNRSLRGARPSAQLISALDNFEGKFVPTQATAKAKLPVFNFDAFKYLAKHYVAVIQDKGMTVEQACMRNSKAAWMVGKYRTSKTWQIIGYIVGREDEEREERERQRKAMENNYNHGHCSYSGGVVARRLLGIGKYYDSASTTPLARPIPDSPRSTPTIGPSQAANNAQLSGNEKNDDNIDAKLLLPPAAFGTSLSSSTASTDGDSSPPSIPEGRNRFSSSVRPDITLDTIAQNTYKKDIPKPLVAKPDTISSSSISMNESLFSSVHQSNSIDSLNMLSPVAEYERRTTTDTEPEHDQDQDHDHDFHFSSSARGSTSPVRINPPSYYTMSSAPERIAELESPVNIKEVSSLEEGTSHSQGGSFQHIPRRRSRQYSIGLFSDQTESSYEDIEREMALMRMKEENRQGIEFGNGLAKSSSNSLQAIVEEGAGGTCDVPSDMLTGMENEGLWMKGPGQGNTPKLEITKVPEDGSAIHKGVPSVIGRSLAGVHNVEVTDVEMRLKPWGSLEEVVKQVTEYYMEQGDVQFNSTLVSLLGDRVKAGVNGVYTWRQLDDWMEAYLEQLQRRSLLIPSAFLVKHSPSDLLRTKGQTNTFVHTSCCWCLKPLNNANTKKGFWYCEKCKKVLDGCVICRRHVKGRWTMCQICGHGGHDECLRVWYLSGEEEGEEGFTMCPAVGCGHECLPR